MTVDDDFPPPEDDDLPPDDEDDPPPDDDFDAPPPDDDDAPMDEDDEDFGKPNIRWDICFLKAFRTHLMHVCNYLGAPPPPDDDLPPDDDEDDAPPPPGDFEEDDEEPPFEEDDEEPPMDDDDNPPIYEFEDDDDGMPPLPEESPGPSPTSSPAHSPMEKSKSNFVLPVRKTASIVNIEEETVGSKYSGSLDLSSLNAGLTIAPAPQLLKKSIAPPNPPPSTTSQGAGEGEVSDLTNTASGTKDGETKEAVQLRARELVSTSRTASFVIFI